MIYPGLFRKSRDRALKRLGLPDYNPHDLRHMGHRDPEQR